MDGLATVIGLDSARTSAAQTHKQKRLFDRAHKGSVHATLITSITASWQYPPKDMGATAGCHGQVSPWWLQKMTGPHTLRTENTDNPVADDRISC